MYVFDTSSLRVLRNYYPSRFVNLWANVDIAVGSGVITSTRECRRELLDQLAEPWLLAWVKKNAPLFPLPTPHEAAHVAAIFAVPGFQALVGQKQRLQGKPVADPFVVAAAADRRFAVVTQEKIKPNAAKIPNVCQHFNIRCIDLEQFMLENNWSF